MIGEPDDRQFFTPGEWGPMLFSVFDPTDDDVSHEFSYDGSETIEEIAEKYPDCFQEVIHELENSSREERDWYA